MIRAVFVALALLAAACTEPTPGDQAKPEIPVARVGIDGRPLVSADGVVDSAVQEALTADPAACARAGGEIRPVCRMQQPMCVVTFADANKACSDSSECGSGRCLAVNTTVESGQPAKGQCSPTNDPCGCSQRIEDGVALPTLCAD
ncbi:MAG: hypothetical protein ABMA14_20235 [Hyphomonadaceae bacterium]